MCVQMRGHRPPPTLTMRANFLAASLDCAVLLAPVQTILRCDQCWNHADALACGDDESSSACGPTLPLWNISAVVLGCRMRMITAEKRCAPNIQRKQSSLQETTFATPSIDSCINGTFGLYSEFLVFTVIFFKSRRVPKNTVLIVFLSARNETNQNQGQQKEASIQFVPVHGLDFEGLLHLLPVESECVLLQHFVEFQLQPCMHRMRFVQSTANRRPCHPPLPENKGQRWLGCPLISTLWRNKVPTAKIGLVARCAFESNASTRARIHYTGHIPPRNSTTTVIQKEISISRQSSSLAPPLRSQI